MNINLSLAQKFFDLGDLESARAACEASLLDEASPEGRFLLAQIYIAAEDPKGAVSNMLLALDSNALDSMHVHGFIAYLSRLGWPRLEKENCADMARKFLATAIKTPDSINKQSLALFVDSVKSLPDFHTALAWVTTLEINDAAAQSAQLRLKDLIYNHVLWAVLAAEIIPDPQMEDLLTGIRSLLLELSVTAPEHLEDFPIGFCTALATQFTMTEFIYDLTEKDASNGNQLIASLKSSAGGDPVETAKRLCIAAMVESIRPLVCEIPDFKKLPDLDPLIKLQVGDPEEEEELDATLQHISGAADHGPGPVQRQYE